jgi:hypothetical protein
VKEEANLVRLWRTLQPGPAAGKYTSEGSPDRIGTKVAGRLFFYVKMQAPFFKKDGLII